MLTRRALIQSLVLASTLEAIPLSRFRLGVTTDEIDDDPAVAAAFLKRYDLHECEVRNLWGKYNTELPLDRINAAKAAFDAQQVRVAVLDTAFFRGPIPTTDEALDKEWDLLEVAMDRADIFGTKTLRIFAFLPADKNVSDKSVLPRIHELLGEAANRAAERNFKLGIENLKGSYIQTAADSAPLLRAVPHPNLGLNWDPNNAGSVGEKSFPDGYKLLDPARIFGVHLRDFKYHSDGQWEWVAVGTGDFDNLGQIRAMLKDGYKGSFTLETHWRAPEGKTYSTETSLKALLKVVAEV